MFVPTADATASGKYRPAYAISWCTLWITLLGTGGCGAGSWEKSWERLDSPQDDLQLYVADSKNRKVEIPVGETSDQSLVTFRLLNRGDYPISIERELKATCGCVQAASDKDTLAPGESCCVTASLSHSPTPAHRTVSLVLTVVSPHYAKAGLSIDVEHIGDWSVSSKSVQLKGVLGSQSKSSFEIDGNKAALDAMTWDVVGDVYVTSSRPTDSRIVLTVQSKIDSLLTEKIAGTIQLHTKRGMPAHVTVPVTQVAEPIGKWSPKALVLAEDSPIANCRMSLVEGAAIKSIDAPGFAITPISGEQPAEYQVSINEDARPEGVQWVIATVSKDSVDQQIKLPVLVKLNSQSQDEKQ